MYLRIVCLLIATRALLTHQKVQVSLTSILTVSINPKTEMSGIFRRLSEWGSETICSIPDTASSSSPKPMTGTIIRRTPELVSFFAASWVCFGLIGYPSVRQKTTAGTPFLPCINSALAVSRASEVYVVSAMKGIFSIFVTVSARLLENDWTFFTRHSSSLYFLLYSGLPLAPSAQL